VLELRLKAIEIPNKVAAPTVIKEPLGSERPSPAAPVMMGVSRTFLLRHPRQERFAQNEVGCGKVSYDLIKFRGTLLGQRALKPGSADARHEVIHTPKLLFYYVFKLSDTCQGKLELTLIILTLSYPHQYRHFHRW
jgi:hypothetical protein